MSEEKYAGDIIEEVLDALGGKVVTTWIEKVTKKPCGCDNRRKRLNAIDQAGREKYRALSSKVKDLMSDDE